jgi:hypothetical protein
MVMQQGLQIDALRSAPVDVERILRPLPPEALTYLGESAKDSWTILDVLGHLIAVDEMMFARCQRILNEDNPAVVGHVPGSVFEGQQVTLDDALRRWVAIREEMCTWLEALPPGAFNRRAAHNERGQITIRTEAQIVIGHDTEHLDQIIALRERWDTTRRLHKR